MKPTLPKPSADAQLHSQKLTAAIQQAINKKGSISFDQYMQMALYQPGLGYYQAGCHKLGKGGDFTTAPEISSLFSYCLARQCQQVLETIGNGTILEFGAGSGKMAGDILHYLNQQHRLPSHYYILEISPDLKARQQDYLKQQCSMLDCEIIWLNALPENFQGVVLANEVLDAMPVNVFCWNGKQLQEARVITEDDHFNWQLDQPSPTLNKAFQHLQEEINFHSSDNSYCSEINLLMPGWIKALAHTIKQGVVLLIDYGFSRAEYYHPDRSMGTLMAHYQHHAHTDPFFYPGLQDLTAHVDFTAVIEAADSNGLELEGFTTQAQWLINLGITELLEQITDDIALTRANQAVKTLTMPTEMGESFKVMALGKQMDLDLLGFMQGDISHKL